MVISFCHLFYRENKSLNVFNTSCVLADPVTTSDANYQRIEGIIGKYYSDSRSVKISSTKQLGAVPRFLPPRLLHRL